MPQAAAKPCTVCQKLVHDGTGRCADHPREAWVKRTPVQRVTGRALQRMRAELFKREPLCRPCRAAGRLTAATLRDHIQPLAEGGLDDDSNVQPICEPCHEEKTLAEALRGRAGLAPRHAPGQGGTAGQGGDRKSGAARPETGSAANFLRG